MDSLQFNDQFFNHIRVIRANVGNIREVASALERIGLRDIAEELRMYTREVNNSSKSIRSDFLTLGRDDLRRSQESTKEVFEALLNAPPKES